MEVRKIVGEGGIVGFCVVRENRGNDEGMLREGR